MGKLCIDDCHIVAELRGGQCDSNVYINNNTKYKWWCDKCNYRWETTYGNVQQGKWCPKCAGHLKLSIDACHIVADFRGGQCKSTEWKGTEEKYLWQCNCGYEWLAKYGNVRIGKWCARCAGNEKGCIEKCHILAEFMGGQCLDNEYKGVDYRYKWWCSKCDYRWETSYGNVHSGKWCQRCGYLRAAKKSNNSYILYHWKTGEEIVCIASYEKAVVESLNNKKENYLWQPETFDTPFKTKMGRTSTYRPDLYLPDLDKWVEIKGLFRGNAKNKWEWFHEEHPNSELWDAKKLKKMGIL